MEERIEGDERNVMEKEDKVDNKGKAKVDEANAVVHESNGDVLFVSTLLVELLVTHCGSYT